MATGGAGSTRLESLLLLVRGGRVDRGCLRMLQLLKLQLLTFCGPAEGSSAQVRENAAERLGEMAAASTESCHAVLQRVRHDDDKS